MSGTSIERVSEAGPRVPRTRLDRIAEWYRSSPVGTWGMVVINAVLQGAGIVLAFVVVARLHGGAACIGTNGIADESLVL